MLARQNASIKRSTRTMSLTKNNAIPSQPRQYLVKSDLTFLASGKKAAIPTEGKVRSIKEHLLSWVNSSRIFALSASSRVFNLQRGQFLLVFEPDVTFNGRDSLTAWFDRITTKIT